MQPRPDVRIFIGLTEVSGYYSNLRRGFEELGIHAVHVPLLSHRFSYEEAIPAHRIVRWARYCVARRVALGNNDGLLRRLLWLFLVVGTRVLLFLWAMTRFDVFILGGGSSFFSFREFRILRLMGKKLIYTFHGTDARPAYIDGFFSPDHIGIALPSRANEGDSHKAPHMRERVMSEAQVIATRRRKAAVRAAERHANAVVCAPSYAQFMTRDFVNFIVVGIPLGLNLNGKDQPESVVAGRAPRILHAPSQSDGKGTAGIRRAVDNLRHKGLSLEYVEITGRPHVEVIAEIKRCDFVIDQLYSDTPMAGFAAEAAYHGKPAIVGSYYAGLICEQMRKEQIPPSLFCLPDAIEDAIAKLLTDSAFRAQLGEKAALFVRQQWHARAVAARYLHVIEGTAPRDWFFPARDTCYVHGVGISETRIQDYVSTLMALFGKDALQLSDKPDLERRLIALAKKR